MSATYRSTSSGAFASRDRDEPLRFRGAAWPIRAASEEALAAYDVVFFASSEDASAALATALAAQRRDRDRQQCDVPDGARRAAVRPGDQRSRGPGRQRRSSPSPTARRSFCAWRSRRSRDAAGLRAVRVSTYQAVSGAGRAGLDELEAGERALVLGTRRAASAHVSAPDRAQRRSADRCVRCERRLAAKRRRWPRRRARFSACPTFTSRRRPCACPSARRTAKRSFLKRERDTGVDGTRRRARIGAGRRVSSRRGS